MDRPESDYNDFNSILKYLKTVSFAQYKTDGRF